ncbi:hypothetical protein ABZ635_13650 [Nocardiopsis sp. NPDC007018]|uniref:HD domain-containing protein n=1 Tax=Nocardiopsis sp. NPDC007018 TaxID=3155721 RepID=UPI0033F16665
MERAAESALWGRVPAGRDAEPFRRAATAFVQDLVPLRDEARARLADDPWLDHGAPLRFHERLTELLGSPDRSGDTDLYPAEAALLVFTPFLLRVYELRRAAERATLGPGSLVPAASPSPDRASFEAFAAEYRGLTERVLRRGQDEAAVGWWLFHRWMARAENGEGIEALWEGAPRLFHRLWKSDRIRHFLHGLRLGRGVCNDEYLADLRENEYVPAEGAQYLRERRLALTMALGLAMAPEPTSLSDTVVEHLAIPYPVDPSQVRRTVAEVCWRGDPHLLSLEAECGHEAVIEGLHQYVERADELLHGIHRVLGGRVAGLPARLSSDRVEPARGAFESWARFRIDERRARELLTGEQLYKNKDLAIRELYQNALDACRYRRARTEYLDRTSLADYAYEGAIEFVQGVDEDGRPYVDCSDDGVGMGEEELRGVFSHAGSRFAEESGFLLERERWAREDPPIRLYPNSRFGIGVLSYFMLADEIRVTTCRMGADGVLGSELEAAIHGPGHLFRVVRTGRKRRTPGTTVRLYLRPDTAQTEWSCVEVLRSVLGIAEFRTTATGDDRHVWEPGVFALRTPERNEEPVSGYWAGGVVCAWEGLHEWADVLWCEKGGALLVDGLLTRPGGNGGVFSTSAAGLDGVVVNLRGPGAPLALSADRSQVLGETEGPVRKVLGEAAVALIDTASPLLCTEWVARLANGSIVLADLVAEAAVRRGVSAPLGLGRYGTKRRGFFPADLDLPGIEPFTRGMSYQRRYRNSPLSPLGRVPAHIFLWRMLVHGDPEVLEELTALCPELGVVTDVRDAVPSDQLMAGNDTPLSAPGFWRGDLEFQLPEILRTLDTTPKDFLGRLCDLGYLRIPRAVLAAADLREPASAQLRQILCLELEKGAPVTPVTLFRTARALDLDIQEVAFLLRYEGFDVPAHVASAAGQPVLEELLRVLGPGRPQAFPGKGEGLPAGALFALSESMERPVPEIRGLLRECGVDAEDSSIPDDLDQGFVRYLSPLGNGGWPWVQGEDVIAPALLINWAQEIGVEPVDMVRVLGKEGLPVPPRFPVDADSGDLDLLYGEGEDFGVSPPKGVTYADIMESQYPDQLDLAFARLREFGFDIPLTLPEEYDDLDEALLANHHLRWWGVRVGDPMPLAHVVVASRELHEGVETIVGRLAGYGMEVSHRSLPEGLSFPAAIHLLSQYGEESEYLNATVAIELDDLVHLAHTVFTSITQVASWLEQLGLSVVDPAQVIRDAIPHIPRRVPLRG